MSNLEERVSFIEGKIESLATKDDLANLETRLVREMSTQLRWLIGIQIGGLVAIAAVLRLLGG